MYLLLLGGSTCGVQWLWAQYEVVLMWHTCGMLLIATGPASARHVTV